MWTLGRAGLLWVTFLLGTGVADAGLAGASDRIADDSALLAEMISVREAAMIERDLDAALSQFAEDATWINSQGYYFAGRRVSWRGSKEITGASDVRMKRRTPATRPVLRSGR